MTPQEYERLTELFHVALEIAPEERTAFLDQVSDGDAELRRELKSLLTAHGQGTHTDKPPNDIAAAYLVQQGTRSARGPSLDPNTRIDHYEIRSLLGKGGMGEVYLAEDTRLHRKVALKILPPEVAANQDRMRRFEQEAQAAAALNHPNIAHIYEIGESESTHFIAIEHIDGDTLRDKIHRDKAPLPTLLKYLIQVAEGLTKAHAAGIVHRDLKPDNIMITRDDYAKILDFGLAKLVEPPGPLGSTSTASSEVSTAIMPQHSLAGMVMGTVGYMSPEQAQGQVEQIDHRSDIFSFGCILYEAVTRHRPFADESVIKSLHKAVYEAAPPIKDFNPSAPPDLQRIVRRCLAKNREERYQTIKDAALELEEVRQGIVGAARIDTTAPASGRGETLGRRTTGLWATSKSSAYLGSQIKSHKRNALLILAVLAAVTAAIVYFTYSRHAGGNGARTINSIAVLPFVNGGGNPETEYLSDGITDSLINNLSQLPNLKVMSRSSVFHYKGKETDAHVVGQELGVQAVLTGRLVQHGDDLTISLELVNASDNSHVWGTQYNRKLSNLTAVPGDISQDVTENLRLKLSGEEKQRLAKRQTNNPEAYQAYLKGVYYSAKFAPGAFEKAIENFNQAVTVEPNYAQAYAGLAHAYAELAFQDLPPQEALLKARPAATRALELDETIAEAHFAMATINLYYDWDWPAAERQDRRAIELSPGDALQHQHYGWDLSLMGRFDEGLTELERAQALDPLSPNINVAIAMNYHWSGQSDRAIEQYRKVIELDPNAGGFTRLSFGEAYLKQRKFPEAIVEIRKAGKYGLATLGYAYAVSGNRAEAEKVLRQLQALSTQKYVPQYVPPFFIALIYVGLDDKDQAFVWLENAYAERSAWMSWLKVDPKFDSLRSDPRFVDLLRRIRLPQ
jgi:serine/threonine-protein kinase